ncbi:MAG: hypothetical protein ACJ8FS_12960 [Sphingomicrobium sp.]
MRNAARILILGLGAVALAACHKQGPQNNVATQDMSIDDNLAAGQLPANAEIETLPPDESSEASNSELSSGQDNPDVNDLGNGH